MILLGDDIDKSSLGPWGGQAHTPHLDQLANDGVRLDCVYANVAMCAPFRQEFFSGQCAWRTGAMPNHSKSVAGTKSLPHYLKPLGYHVGLLGKKHIGPRDAYPFEDLGDLPKDRDANEDAVTNGVETVRFSELLRDKAGYRYLEDLGTEPNVYYLPPVDRLFPFEENE